MYEGPEFSHLVAFVAVAEECSFTAAAKRIRVAVEEEYAHHRHSRQYCRPHWDRESNEFGWR
jgi:hypothetical protein